MKLEFVKKKLNNGATLTGGSRNIYLEKNM